MNTYARPIPPPGRDDSDNVSGAVAIARGIFYAAIIMMMIALLGGCATVSEVVAEKVVAKVDAPPVESSSISTPLPLRSLIVAHLSNAADIARADNDAPGLQCWTILGKWVETLPLGQADVAADTPLPEATGPSGRAELVRIQAKRAQARVGAVKARVAALRGIIDAGMPDDVVTACAVVVNDARTIAARVLALIGLAL